MNSILCITVQFSFLGRVGPYRKHAKIIPKQLYEISEIPNITTDIVREKLDFALKKHSPA